VNRSNTRPQKKFGFTQSGAELDPSHDTNERNRGQQLRAHFA
jgi:hypothetical protein